MAILNRLKSFFRKGLTPQGRALPKNIIRVASAPANVSKTMINLATRSYVPKGTQINVVPFAPAFAAIGAGARAGATAARTAYQNFNKKTLLQKGGTFAKLYGASELIHYGITGEFRPISPRSMAMAGGFVLGGLPGAALGASRAGFTFGKEIKEKVLEEVQQLKENPIDYGPIADFLSNQIDQRAADAVALKDYLKGLKNETIINFNYPDDSGIELPNTPSYSAMGTASILPSGIDVNMNTPQQDYTPLLMLLLGAAGVAGVGGYAIGRRRKKKKKKKKRKK